MMKNEIFEIKLSLGKTRSRFVIKEGDGFSIIGENDGGKSQILSLIARRGKGVSYRGNKSKLSKEEQNLFDLEIGYFDGSTKECKEEKVEDLLDKASVKFNMLVSEIADIFDISQEEYEVKIKNTRGFLSLTCSLLDKLCKDYKILLFDDAFGLDFAFKKKLTPFLKEIGKNFSLTYVIATTDPFFASALTGYALLVENGMPVEYGKCDVLLKKPLHPYSKWFVASAKNKKDASVAFVRTAKDEKPPKKACRFAMICPWSSDECKKRAPEFTAKTKESYTACHKV